MVRVAGGYLNVKKKNMVNTAPKNEFPLVIKRRPEKIPKWLCLIGYPATPNVHDQKTWDFPLKWP
jgi:hypothetical protein